MRARTCWGGLAQTAASGIMSPHTIVSPMQQPESSLRELTESLNVADLAALVATFRDLAAEVHLRAFSAGSLRKRPA